MLRARRSAQVEGNTAVKALRRSRGESNRKWLLRADAALDPALPKVLLLGGTSLTDFRIRVAQSDARRDMKPSLWSHAAVYMPSKSRPSLWHVPLEVGDDVSSVPRHNAIVKSTLDYCADEDRWKNLALLQFHGVKKTTVGRHAKQLVDERLSMDLVSPLLGWLAYVWGSGDTGNPLLAGIPLPTAAFVESVFARSDIDLAPGMADRTLCPEAIWQSAKWWSDFYAGHDEDAKTRKERIPCGRFVIGQYPAAIRQD